MARFFRRKKYCRFTAEGIEQIDYKDLGDPQELHHGDRQDRPEPDHRDAVALSASARRRDQARALSGAVAVHRPALRLAGSARGRERSDDRDSEMDDREPAPGLPGGRPCRAVRALRAADSGVAAGCAGRPWPARERTSGRLGRDSGRRDRARLGVFALVRRGTCARGCDRDAAAVACSRPLRSRRAGASVSLSRP